MPPKLQGSDQVYIQVKKSAVQSTINGTSVALVVVSVSVGFKIWMGPNIKITEIV